ncbi:O-antigen polymerase [Lachnospiraceae bacterium LCP25S3_G4]
MKENDVRVYNKKIIYGIYSIGYLISYVLANLNYHYLAAIILMVIALGLYIQAFVETDNLVDMKGIFSLSWIGGQGLACLQLSKLQGDWNPMTWLCFGVAYLCFCFGYDKIWNRRNMRQDTKKEKLDSGKASATMSRKILFCIVLLAIASIVSFVIEALVVGYIPIFSDLPHAYSYFHVSGVHYFTISCILIPALTVIYAKEKVLKSKGVVLILGICNIISIAIPILCVSRFQLLFAVMFAIVVYIVAYKKIPIKKVFMLIIILIPIYALLTVARNHDVSYLNSIFEMKNVNMPIFITQPYMYIANNYENFNCMVEQLMEHTHGLKMIFPALALTGLKFVFPQWVALPLYITKEELTTLTIFYDAYFDFGLLGVMALAFVLGLVAKKLTRVVKQRECNPIMYLFYGQIAIYLGLSFFTTWFSNPTTWFWLALTTMMYIYLELPKKKKDDLNERADESRRNHTNI